MNLRILGLALALVGAFQVSAHATLPVLLDIDETNPSSVVFTGTDANSANTVSDPSGNIRLVGFFTSLETTTPYTDLGAGSDLKIVNKSLDYTEVQINQNYLTFSPSVDPVGSFTYGSPALVGSATFDLSADEADLPLAGAVGLITAGGTNIGIWEVTASPEVPEPSNVALMGVLTALTAFVAYRRRSAAGAKPAFLLALQFPFRSFPNFIWARFPIPCEI